MAQGDVPRQLAAFFELLKIKKFQNESREAAKIKVNRGHVYRRMVLPLTQLDNRETFSSTEERLKGQNPVLGDQPSPLLSAAEKPCSQLHAVLHAARLCPLPDTQCKFKGLLFFIFPAIPFWKTRVRGHVPARATGSKCCSCLRPL